MKSNIKWISYMTIGLLFVALLGACGHRYHSPKENADWMVDKVTSKLELNDAQVNKLNNLKQVLLEAREDFQQRREAGRESINALIAQPTLDRTQALELIKVHTTAINAEAPQVIAALGDFYDSLNPDQQNQLREFIKDRMDHHKRGWH